MVSQKYFGESALLAHMLLMQGLSSLLVLIFVYITKKFDLMMLVMQYQKAPLHLQYKVNLLA